MSDVLKEIKIPSLSSTDYGAALSEQFGNINLNFQKIANTGLYKGDDGKSSQYIPYNLNAIFVYCTEEDETTNEGQLFNEFLMNLQNAFTEETAKLYDKISHEVEEDYTIYNKLTSRTKSQYAQDVATILYGQKHIFDVGSDIITDKSLIGSVYYPNSDNLGVYINFGTGFAWYGCWLQRFYGMRPRSSWRLLINYLNYNPGRILMSYTLDNQDITYLGSAAYIYIDPRFRNEYIGKVEVSDWGRAEDVSCVIYWDNSIQGFRSLNLFPQIYFDGSGFFWKINDQKTHIPVSGPAGTDGKSSRMYVCVRKEMVNSTGTLSTPAVGDFVVPQNVYTGKPAHNTTDLEKIRFGEADIPANITANEKTHQYTFNSANAWQSETAVYANVDPSNMFEVDSVIGYETLTNTIKQELDGASCIVLPGEGFSLNRSNNVVWFTNFKTTTDYTGNATLSVFCSTENQLTTEIDEHIFAGLMMSLDPFDYKTVSDNRNKPRGLYIPIGSMKVEGSGSDAYAAHVIYSDNNPLSDRTDNETRPLAGARTSDGQTQVVVDKKILHIGSVDDIQELNQCESFEKPAVPGVVQQYDNSAELHVDEPITITNYRDAQRLAPAYKPLLTVEGDVLVGPISHYDSQNRSAVKYGGVVINNSLVNKYGATDFSWFNTLYDTDKNKWTAITSDTNQTHDFEPSIVSKYDIFGQFLISQQGFSIGSDKDSKFFVDGSGNISYNGRYNLNCGKYTIGPTVNVPMGFGSVSTNRMTKNFGWFKITDNDIIPCDITPGDLDVSINYPNISIYSQNNLFQGTVDIIGGDNRGIQSMGFWGAHGLNVRHGIFASAVKTSNISEKQSIKIENNGSDEAINPAFYTENDSVYAGDAVVAKRFVRNIDPAESVDEKPTYRLLMDNGWSTASKPVEVSYGNSFLTKSVIQCSWIGDNQAMPKDNGAIMRLQLPTAQIFQKNAVPLYLFNDAGNASLSVGVFGNITPDNTKQNIYETKTTDQTDVSKFAPKVYSKNINISVELDINEISFDFQIPLTDDKKILGIQSTSPDLRIFPDSTTGYSNVGSANRGAIVGQNNSTYGLWRYNTGWIAYSGSITTPPERISFYKFTDNDKTPTNNVTPIDDGFPRKLTFDVENKSTTVKARTIFGHLSDPKNESYSNVVLTTLGDVFNQVVTGNQFEYKNPIEPVFVTLNGEVGSVNFVVDTEGRLLFVSCTSDYKFKGSYVNLKVSWSLTPKSIDNKPSTGKDSYEVIDSGTLIKPTPSTSGTLIDPTTDPSKKQATKQNPFVYGRQVYEDGSVGNWELISQYVGAYTYIASTDVAYTANSKIPVPGGFIALMNGDTPYKLGGFSNYIPAGDAKYVTETSDGYIKTDTEPGNFGDIMLEYCNQYISRNMESFKEFTLPGYGHVWRILTNTWESKQWKASDFEHICDNSEDVTNMFLSTVPSTMKSAYGGHTVKCSYNNGQYQIETNFDDTTYDITERKSSVSIFKQDTWENKPEYVNLFLGIMFREIINRNGNGSTDKVYGGDQIGWTMKNQDVIFSNAGQHRNNMSARIVEVTPTDDSDTSKRMLQARVRMYIDMMGTSDDILGIKGMVDFTVDSFKWEDKYYVADEYDIRNLSGMVLDDPKWLIPHLTINNAELIFESCTAGLRSTCSWDGSKFAITKIS